MNARQSEPAFSLVFAFGFEMALGLAAFVLGWLFSWSPAQSLAISDVAQFIELTGWGLAATAPMVLLLAFIELVRIRPLEEFRRLVREQVAPVFQSASPLELAGLALAAGVGEELFFRGLLQDGLAHWFDSTSGVWTALILVSVLFGVAHWLSNTYALLAALIGLYLGFVFIACDHLLPAIIAHALYDLIALTYLVRESQRPANVTE